MWNELFWLFSSGFISATLFPGGSELLFAYFLQKTPDNAVLYFAVITLANSLGALVSYLMGYYFYWGREKAQNRHQKAWQFCQRYGSSTLLLSWLPIVGDLLPLVAGWLKLPLYRSVLFIFIGKALRYWLVAYSCLYLLQNS